MLELVPVTLKQAQAFVAQYHRHHGPPLSWKFGVSVVRDDELVGVGIAGRPVARMTDSKEPRTIEITRVCSAGEPHVPSMIYGALSRASFALGYNKVISIILKREPGTSLKAAGFVFSHNVRGGKWSRAKRPRKDLHPTGPKKCFKRELAA